MARWFPPTDDVGTNEHVGRRLFDEPLLAGATDQPVFAGLALSHFEETRDNEWSMDRLGRSSLDRKVVNYLLPRAREASLHFHVPKRFDGWVFLRSQELRNPGQGPSLTVVPSPIVGHGNPQENETDLTLNIYHAHITKPDGIDPYEMALHLRHLFTRNVRLHRVGCPDASTASRGIIVLIYRWLVENVVARLRLRHR
jgi:hypothetical protein